MDIRTGTILVHTVRICTVCTYVQYASMYVHMYIWMHVRILYVCIQLCTYVFMYVCTVCTYTYVHTYVCMYVCNLYTYMDSRMLMFYSSKTQTLCKLNYCYSMSFNDVMCKSHLFNKNSPLMYTYTHKHMHTASLTLSMR